MRSTLAAFLLLILPLLAAPPARSAQPNHAASCILKGGLAALIRLQLNAALPELNGGKLGSGLKVDAIVIHSVANPNNGQPLDAGGFTGPIVCTFQEGFIPPQTPYNITSVASTTSITNIDLLSSEVETLIQYRRPSGTGSIEKLLCLSTRNNNDCFRIFPASTR